MLANNYRYSVTLAASTARTTTFRCSMRRRRRSTAPGAAFREERACEAPLNVYGYSKLLFDQYVRRTLPERTAQIAGFRYFNVYGPREAHKGRMASVVWHFFNQYRDTGKVQLFEGSGGYAAGEQRRDFVSVDDVVAVNLRFSRPPGAIGHLQSRHRDARRRSTRSPTATINACRAADGAAPLRVRRAASRRRDRIHRLSAGSRRQVPELHPGRRRAAARGGLRRARSPAVDEGVADCVRALLAANASQRLTSPRAFDGTRRRPAHRAQTG